MGAVIQGDENTGGAMARDCKLLAAARKFSNGLPKLAPKARKTECRDFGFGVDGIFQTIRLDLSSIVEAENVLHGVEAGFLAENPLGGAEGAVGESVSAAGFVGEFEAFSGSGEQDGVIADDVAAAQGMHADFIFGSGADDSLAAVFQGVVWREIAGLGEDVCEGCGSAAGGVLFVMVVHFDDFEVEAVSQDFRCFAGEPEKGVDAGGVVGGPNYGNFVG